MTVRVVRSSFPNIRRLPGTEASAVAIGNFDGLHRGHAALFERLAATRGVGERAVVVSFHPHPRVVLSGNRSTLRLSTVREERRVLARAGIDTLYLIRFDEPFSRLAPSQFIDAVLVDALRARSVVLGPDARVGYQGAGTVDVLIPLLVGRGIRAEVVPFLEEHGARVSSTKIRELLAAGDAATAGDLLGRSYALEGRIVRGEGRGKPLGIPTANLHVAPGLMAPARGVYAARCVLHGTVHPGVVNIGVKPTFGEARQTVEAHLLDYRGADFYGERLRIEFVCRVREERKFPNAAALVEQIHRDIEETRDLLAAR